jgi:hypothetical protein
LDDIAEYLRFLSKAQLFWFTLNSSYDHGGEAAVVFDGSNKRQQGGGGKAGATSKVVNTTINLR